MSNKIAGIVRCSNPLAEAEQVDSAKNFLQKLGYTVQVSDCLFNTRANAVHRAEEVMECYANGGITEILDVSGGDLANGVLEYLDYSLIEKSAARFWGYSDLTTVLNAIYSKTGKESVLYQLRTVVWDKTQQQANRLQGMLLNNDKSLLDFSYRFLQGDGMKGVLVGGNIRCLLKLAGTPYFPPTKGNILLLEAYSGTGYQMSTYLTQLKQMGVLNQVSGILLGTFMQMEGEKETPTMEQLVLQAAPGIAVAKTEQIGHGVLSRAAIIGRTYQLERK